MRVEDTYQLGYTQKPHGIRGELKAVFDVDDIEVYSEQELVYILKEGKLALVHLDKIRLLNHREAIIQIRGIHSRSEAEAYQGLGLYLPLDALPELKPGQFYYHDIPGYQVVDQKLGRLGKVREVREMPAQDILVMDYQESEILIPITWNIVLEANHETREIHTHLPDGHLDVYR